MFDFSIFAHSETWISLLMLTLMEIVLGIDNIIFLTIIANRLPKKEQKRARNLGLMIALGMRLFLLLFVGYITQLQKPLFHIDFAGIHAGFSGQSLILIAGGIFLLYKSTTEIHHKLEGNKAKKKKDGTNNTQVVVSTIGAVIVQIALINLVFSVDSILTAIGLTKDIPVMMLGVIFSILVMMLFAGPVGDFVNRHPTVQMLGLAFLILIGFMLVAEGAHQAGMLHPVQVAEYIKDVNGNMVSMPTEIFQKAEDGSFVALKPEEGEVVPKSYLYFAIFFSLIVEMLNLRLRKTTEDPVELRGATDEARSQGLMEEFE
jgi:predicted tellurium resistance membrane protein TerC